MDNITLARLLDETASLLEIDAADPFRIRSYRRAAEAVEQQTTMLSTLVTAEADPKALLAIPGIASSALPSDSGPANVASCVVCCSTASAARR